MEILLKEYFGTHADIFGEVGVSYKAERFCINLPEQTTEYVHEHTERSGFLYDFIGTIGKHGISMEDVLSVFRSYSEQVHVEEVADSDFDYLVYFENGVPDSYRYCLTQESHHIIYHRYTMEDYEELFS